MILKKNFTEREKNNYAIFQYNKVNEENFSLQPIPEKIIFMD